MPAAPCVAHVVLSLNVGGLERLVIDLVREGKQLGQRQAVVCVEREGTLTDDARSLGAVVYCLDKRPGLQPKTVGRCANLFRKIQPDVVHTHQIGALTYAGRAARRTGVPVVVHTEHGKHYAQRLRTRWLGRWAGRYADKFCCVSADIADEVRRTRVVPNAKILVVPNGIDVARFAQTVSAANLESKTDNLKSDLGIPAQAPVIGTIGRLNEVKRQDVLIRGFAKLAARRPDAHLVVVGDGPLRGELEALAASTARAGNIHFVGYQSQPERWLQTMDIFALTSRSEGMPLSILEAWAAGVPVVASAVGGVPQLIADGHTGLLFESGDESAFRDSLARLLSDRSLGIRMACAARQRVEFEFSLAAMAQAYQELYREVFERPAAMEQPISPPPY